MRGEFGDVISIHALLAESDVGCSQGRWQPDGFLSTLSLRRATKCRHKKHLISQVISIHALLAESDFFRGWTLNINGPIFLSTLSLRRATWGVRKAVGSLMDFYPRSPCGERRARRASRQQPAGISIHALLAESDYQKNLNP